MAEGETIWQQGKGRGGAYRAFLVRCWQEPGAGPQGGPAWRFTLVVPNSTSIQKGFASLEDLVHYLRQELKMNVEMNGGSK